MSLTDSAFLDSERRLGKKLANTKPSDLIAIKQPNTFQKNGVGAASINKADSI